MKTPALPCSPAIPGRADGWAGNDHPVVSFPTTGGWQQWLPLVAAIMAPCGHLAASSHAGRARGPAGEQNRAGANLGISTPGRRGATSGWKEEADAPPGCSMPTTPSWFWHAVHRSPRRRGGRRTDRSAGQERRRAAAVSLLSNNRFGSNPGSWDDGFSISVKTVWMSLVFNLTNKLNLVKQKVIYQRSV